MYVLAVLVWWSLVVVALIEIIVRAPHRLQRRALNQTIAEWEN
jgi:hypothetical protein